MNWRDMQTMKRVMAAKMLTNQDARSLQRDARLLGIQALMAQKRLNVPFFFNSSTCVVYS